MSGRGGKGIRKLRPRLPFGRRFRRRWSRGERGQALAEVALIIPILLLIIFGLIEFANAWRSYQVVTNAAREGARRAVMPLGFVDPREGTVCGIVEDVMTAGGLAYDPARVTLSCNGQQGSCESMDGLCDTGRGSTEEVRIDYPYSFVLLGPLTSLAGGDGSAFGTITITATSRMRQE